ncbi:MAG: sugar ABC transporter permease [Butyrivibrio sp.]|nr:sugar ABC transporter permease [Butyrivibrio sp.]
MKASEQKLIQGESFRARLYKDWKRNKAIYGIAFFCLLYYVVFRYAPMGGIVIAFKNYRAALGLAGSEWVGLKWFKEFFSSFYLPRLVRNTLTINLLNLVIGGLTPILFALLVNEIRHPIFKRTVQTVSYMPHFISMVVACSIVLNIISYNGLLNQLREFLGLEAISFATKPAYFPWIYVISDLWQELGFNSIVYLAALSAVSAELLDAAAIDGCNRFQRVLHVTIPAITPTIIIMMLMRIGRIMSVGYEKIILLYNDAVLETADVMSSFVYRYGMLGGNYSYSAAVDLFNNVINVLILILFNRISRKVSDISLW